MVDSAGGGASKVCGYCGQDCSRKPRVKNDAGQYFCESCVQSRGGVVPQRHLSVAAPSKPAPTAAQPVVKAAAVSKPVPAAAEAEALPDFLMDLPAEQAPPAAVSAPVKPTPCPKCKAMLPVGGVLCTACGYNVQTKKKAKTKRVEGSQVGRAAAAGAGIFVLWTAAASVGGAIGLAIWIGVLVKTGYEHTWLALLVGGIVGGCVAITGPGRLNTISGLIAAGVSIFVVVGWKMALPYVMGQGASVMATYAAVDLHTAPDGDERTKAHMTDDIYAELMEKEPPPEPALEPEVKKPERPRPGYTSGGGGGSVRIGRRGRIRYSDPEPEEEPEPEVVINDAVYAKAQAETEKRWAKMSDLEKYNYKIKAGEEMKIAAAGMQTAMEDLMQSYWTPRAVFFSLVATVFATGIAYHIGANGFDFSGDD